MHHVGAWKDMVFNELNGDPDGELVAVLDSGKWAEALQLLMQRHGRDVYQFCSRMLRDPTLAEDVHQQVFIAVYRDLSRFAGRSTVRSWLFGIAHHRVLDAMKCRARRESREVELAEVAEVSDPRPLPIESIDDSQLRSLLDAALDRLGERARMAVVLRYQHGLSFDEMAAICGDEAAVLRTRVSRALRRLRAEIEADATWARWPLRVAA
jgi:RNA polymerase sigma factor (sigma-70 family)